MLSDCPGRLHHVLSQSVTPSKKRRTFSFKDMYHLFRTMSVVVIIMRMGMKDGV
jgi:hypothetical protein